jgi:hypothetical protein
MSRGGFLSGENMQIQTVRGRETLADIKKKTSRESETLKDIKNMFINAYGNLIVVDVSGCELGHNKQAATLAVARLRAKVGPRQQSKAVDVKWDDGDVRSFRVPVNTDSDMLLHDIINQRMYVAFEKWT